MKYLFFITCLFVSNAEARDCNLAHDQTNKLFVDCRLGPMPKTYTKICPMVDKERDAEVYNAEIVTRDRDGSITSRKQWNIGDELAKGESIHCSISATRKQDKVDAKAAKAAAEKAKNDKKRSDWETLCASAKKGIETLLCEERGY